MATLGSAAIEVVGVCKSFSAGMPVLKEVGFCVASGEMVALIGASGSGKSTLIRAIAGLISIDRPRQRAGDPPGGRISIMGEQMQAEGRICASAARIRARVGVVFQQFNLVPRLSVLSNVCLGLLGQIPRWRGTLARFSTLEKQRAMRALTRVGIAEQALKRGSELSGGQQQRAAIARTLVQRASVIIADEPIASLDPRSARRVMDTLAELNRHDKITMLISLHQVDYALAYCSRTIALREGRIVYDGPSSALTGSFLSELYGEECHELLLPPAGGQGPWRRNGHAQAAEAAQAAGMAQAPPGSASPRHRSRDGPPPFGSH
jgi:phosphonate transport system ATP-binding protein